MVSLPLVIGLGCVAWTLIELVGAANRASAMSRVVDFGAVDADSGAPIRVDVDRRGRARDRRRGPAPARA